MFIAYILYHFKTPFHKFLEYAGEHPEKKLLLKTVRVRRPLTNKLCSIHWFQVPCYELQGKTSCKCQVVSCKKKQETGVGGCGFVVGKSKKTWLTVERFVVLRGKPVVRSRARVCSSFLDFWRWKDRYTPRTRQTIKDRLPGY